MILAIFPNSVGKSYKREYSDIKPYPEYFKSQIQEQSKQLKVLLKNKNPTPEEQEIIDEMKKDIEDNKENIVTFIDKIKRYESLFVDGKEPNIIIKKK